MDDVNEILQQTEPEVREAVQALNGVSANEALEALAILAGGVLAIHLILRILRRALGRLPGETRTLTNFLVSILRILLGFVLVTVIFAKLGIPVTSLVAVLSLFGLAISLSVQNLFSNVASGLALLTNHPFKAGEWIETPSTSGTVESIGLMYTKLLSADGRVILIPNSELAGQRIVNYSSRDKRTIRLTVRVGYDQDNETVKAALLLAAAQVSAEKATAVTSAYTDAGAEYLLCLPVENRKYWDVYYALLDAVRQELVKTGISLGVPARVQVIERTEG